MIGATPLGRRDSALQSPAMAKNAQSTLPPPPIVILAGEELFLRSGRWWTFNG